MDTIEKVLGFLNPQVLILIIILMFRKNIGTLIAAISDMMSRASKLSIGKDGISFEEKVREIAKEESEKKAIENRGMVAQMVSNKMQQSVPLNQIQGFIDSGDTTEATRSVENIPALKEYRYSQLESLTEVQKEEIYSGNAEVADDNQKWRWGRLARRSNRLLTGKVDEVMEGLYVVTVTVESTDPEKDPLLGYVIFHLHKSFPFAVQKVTVVNNRASYTMICYGSFTVGAETDNQAVQLELDLAEIPGVSRRFIES